MTARKSVPRLCAELRTVLQESRLEGKSPGIGHHEIAVSWARRIQRRLSSKPLPRAVRELLRDVALFDHARYVRSRPFDDWVPGMLAHRAAKLLGTTPDAIVARARKVRK